MSTLFIHLSCYLFIVEWLSERGQNTDFENLSKEDLDALLTTFYAEARTVAGKMYSRSALIGIRSSINRHLQSPPYNRSLNISTDESFMSSNQVLKAMMKKLKSEGKDTSKHHDSIDEGDIRKMYATNVLSNDTPDHLLNKVFFEILLHFGRRGSEGLRDLKKKTFEITEDADGNEYVQLCFNEKQKNNTGAKPDGNRKEGRMYAQSNDPNCPVKSYKLYVSKLSPKCDAFFQQPLNNVTTEKQVWYANQPVGHNKLGEMMKRISKKAGLSKVYTNHCVRATTVTVLNKSGVVPHQICHKRVESLAPYIDAMSSDEKQVASSCLHKFGKSEQVAEIDTRNVQLESTNLVKSNTHGLGNIFSNCSFGDSASFNITINQGNKDM